MRWRIAFAAVLALTGTGLVLAPVADAVGAPTSAWWSRLATTSPTDESPTALPVPGPTSPDTAPVGATVPEGQLLVEGTPEGTTALAAARWELGNGESAGTLTLPVAPGSTVTPESVILACKAAAPWTAPEENPGAWDTHPLVDGARCVNGVIADDTMSVTFGVQPLASGTTLDVVFAPGRATEPPEGVPEPPVDTSGSSFRWLFDAPGADALEVVAGDDTSSGFGGGGGFDVPGASSGAGFSSAPFSVSPAPDLFGSPAGVAPEPPVQPALEPEDLAPSVPDLEQAVPVTAGASAPDRTIGFVLLLIAAAMAAWAHLSDDGRAGAVGLGRFRTVPVGAGAAAGDGTVGTLGGLGRFTRERSGPPTPLA